MAVDLCPWLGTFEDSQTQHAVPAKAHACYAQKRPAEIDLEYQDRVCLTGEHRSCRFYREPAAAPGRKPVAPIAAEDDLGPPPSRFPVLRLALWVAALILVAAVVYFYGSSFLAPVPTPVAAAAGSSPTASPVPTSTPDAVAVDPTSVPGALRPTATPTPYPGGALYALAAEPTMAGWVASDESRGNHLGDSYLYAGVFDGVMYHGLVQFDLSPVPRGATIYAAVLEISGLDARRLGSTGVWEVRILDRSADNAWSRQSFQDAHNADVLWSLPPALGVNDLGEGTTNAFALSPEQLRDLEQRLTDEHYALSVRLDGPLAGDSSLFAWDAGGGPASQGRGPRLLLNVGPPPETPIPTGSPPPTNTPVPSLTPALTDTPNWFVVTSTPTPANAVTAAAVALQATARATTTGTPTPLPEYVATATPAYVVVTNTPTPGTLATALYAQELATANVILTGTPTPSPPLLVTATPTPGPTSTPRPTPTPVYVWLDELAGTPTATVSPTPTIPPIPPALHGKILFMSDRRGQAAVYVLEPGSGRVALLTSRWPYDVAMQRESSSPDRQAQAYVQNDARHVPQVYIYSQYYGGAWQVTFNTGMSYDPVWSPTGDRLAFVSTEGGNDEIYVIDTDGKNQRRLTFNQWEWDKHPSWSPDGRQIVFWSNEGSGRRQIWIVDVDGGEPRMLLDSPYNDWDPVWIK